MFKVSGKRTNLIIHARRDREEAESLYRQMVSDGFDDVRIDEDHEGDDAYGSGGEELAPDGPDRRSD